MLEIKFDDATRERAYTSYSQGGGTATNLYADFYAALIAEMDRREKRG